MTWVADAGEDIRIRFENRFAAVPDAGCWIWIGDQTASGYGRMRVEGKQVLAHRVSYELHRGFIAEGIFVCHKCDVRLCVNPDHLFLGTQKDNVTDMIQKGRNSRSGAINPVKHERHHKAKINKQQAAEIFQLAWFSPMSQREIGEAYGLSQTNVSVIKHGLAWYEGRRKRKPAPRYLIKQEQEC